MYYLKEFVKASHRMVEQQPQAYGPFHIAFAVLSIAIIVGVCFLMRKNSDRTFRAVMLSVGLLLIFSEVYKQLYFLWAAGDRGYDWYIFPYQLCSVPMYLSVAVGCMKKCRVRDALCNYLATIGLLGGLMAYIEPSGILNEHYFTLIHSCVWHALLIFFALYILFTGNAGRHFKDYRAALWVLGGVVLCATALNFIFRHKPDFNMCYISPFYNTPLAVFSSFDVFFQGILGQYPGRVLSILIYIFALALGGLILHTVSCYCVRKIRNRVQGPSNNTIQQLFISHT